MSEITKEFLLQTVQALIQEGHNVLQTTFDAGSKLKNVLYVSGRPKGVDLQLFSKWQASCLNLMRLLEDQSTPWITFFENRRNNPINVKRMLGTLEGIEQAIHNGLLIRMEALLRAKTFTHLLDQADYLFSEGYILAAGVMGRAVLEEHLRNWCSVKKCSMAKSRPTLNDFKNALYKKKHITAVVLKHIESMAAIGNEAAHNKESLSKDSVERLLRDIRDFILKYS